MAVHAAAPLSRRRRARAVAASAVLALGACDPTNLSPIAVVGGGGAESSVLTVVRCVADVNVTLRGVTGDLDVALEAPGGARVTLLAGDGGGADLTFDDEARAPFAEVGSVVTGTYRPAEMLSAFDGIRAAGRWTLHAIARGPGGGAIAGGWGVVVTACGQSRPAVVRDSVDWYLRDSLTSGDPTTLITFGGPPLTPMLGDWDGDGSAIPGTFERGLVRLAGSETVRFGDERGFGVAGDFDGDGRDDVAVYRDGTWEIRFADGAPSAIASFGNGSWPLTVPVAGDWDGDGVDGLGTVSAGTWAVRNRPVGRDPADRTFTLGPPSGAYPVVGDWTGDGRDAPGHVEGSRWTVYFDDPFTAGDAWSVFRTFDFGQPGDLPLAGP